jgi:hypothetical protein
MSFRCFAPADEEIAHRWSSETATADLWTLGPAIGTGEAGSFHITSAEGRRGACKPAFGANSVPRAAHEKIAADLAFQVKLSVPPCSLWREPHSGSLYSISNWAFPQAMMWRDVAPKLSATFKKNAAPPFSAARVFHTWIADTDHNGNDGNVIVDVTKGEDFPGIAFIDHAYSMSIGPDFATAPVQPLGFHYIPQDHFDADATAKMVRYINDLEATMIESIVRRLPLEFLPPDRAEVIIKGLLKRRPELAGAFGVVLA